MQRQLRASLACLVGNLNLRARRSYPLGSWEPSMAAERQRPSLLGTRMKLPLCWRDRNEMPASIETRIE